MPNTEPIIMPSGASFAKTVGENPDYYLIINGNAGSFSQRIASLTKEDILMLYDLVINEPVINGILIHPLSWETCGCEGCTIYRKEYVCEHLDTTPNFETGHSTCNHCNKTF